MKLGNLLSLITVVFMLSTTEAHAQVLSQEITVLMGQLVAAGPGTLTMLSSSDTRVATGAIIPVGVAPINRGRVRIDHTPGAQVIISVPGTIILSGADAPTFTPTIEGGAIQTIPAGGTLYVYIGGTFTFTAALPLGSLNCIVPVTVDPF
jgi:Domain of unknown function (DUF4402)